MVVSLKKLAKRRQGFWLNAKNEIIKIEQLGDPPTESNAQSEYVKKLSAVASKLAVYTAEISKLDDQIYEEIPDDEDSVIDAENKATSEFWSKTLDVQKAVEATLSALAQSPTSDVESQSGVSNPGSGCGTGRGAKLPKLEINPFNGDPLRYQEFRDIFDTTIHDREDLKPVDKLKYLHSYLTGEAADAVAGYRLTASNYEVVLKVVEERFGDPELAIQKHMEMLIAVSSDPNDPNAVQHIYYECERHIRSLVALGMSEETFGKVFTPLILAKLPHGVCVQLHRQKQSAKWELSTLRQLLKEEIQAREMSQHFSQRGSTRSSMDIEHRNGGKPKGFKAKPTGGALAKVAQNVRCAYCEGNHYSDQCQKISTATSRKAKLMANRRCFRCLGTSHEVGACKATLQCFYCGRDHHRSICRKQFPDSDSNREKKGKWSPRGASSGPEAPSSPKQGSDRAQTQKQSRCSDNAVCKGSKAVQTRMAIVHFPEQEVNARIYLDNGCSRSYVTQTFADRLGTVPTGTELLESFSFGDKAATPEDLQSATIYVPVRNGQRQPATFLITDHICCPVTKYAVDVGANPILEQVPLADVLVEHDTRSQIDMLIGEDHYDDFVGTERIILDSGLKLTGSKFGYILHGLVQGRDGVESTSNMLRSSNPVSTCNLSRFWALEDTGVKGDPYCSDDDVALDKFTRTIRFNPTENRYDVTFPWKDGVPELPTNYGIARGCLNSLLSRLARQPQVLEQYHKTIIDQRDRGIIEEAPRRTEARVHYIPHHCVVKPDKLTTKIRIVYNASAKQAQADLSINQCLLRGPVCPQNMVGVILRFRMHAQGITTDIEKAFLMVGLQEQDRDVTRFLWLRDESRPLSDDNMVTYRFRRVPFGFVCSPFLLDATIRYHMQQASTDVAKDIMANLYVDNVITGTDSVHDGVRFYHQTKHLFGQISMNAREWYTNSSDLRDKFAAADRGISKAPTVLGIPWDLGTDRLTGIPAQDLSKGEVTKRSILRTVSTVYDPCGLIAPVIVAAKVIIQDLWKQSFPWDKPVNADIADRWREVNQGLATLSQISVPRHAVGMSVDQVATTQIHCFCDASARAYGAAIYLRSEALSGSVVVRLVFAKARLAPIKAVSLPRLELLAVRLGSVATRFVVDELQLGGASVHIWSDAKCALHWIHSRKAMTVFVENQVREIRKQDFRYRYVPTCLNPGDIVSRGCSADELQHLELWWSGPRFLLVRSDTWPEDQFEIPAGVQVEERKPGPSMSNISQPRRPTGIGLVIQIERFSQLNTLLRVTAYLRKAIRRFRHATSVSIELSADDTDGALLEWLLWCQQFLPVGPNLTKVPKSLQHLDLIPDKGGLIRCRGRLGKASVPERSRFPILLPTDSRVTKLIVEEAHRKLMHAGVNQTLAQVREVYWIHHGRSVVRRILKECGRCRRVEGGPFPMPDSPPLPSFRVSRSPAFSHTGLDYLGPLYIREGSENRKVWMCLFTCAVTRAVHLEIVLDNTSEQFLLALRRFCALFGRPELVVSDNASTFRMADSVMKDMLHSESVQAFSSSQGVRWKFITSLAPWMGGFYERLVGSVKRALRKVLGVRCLRLDQLQTMAYEVAAVVNARPIAPGDKEAGDFVLTPAHFLAKQGRLALTDPGTESLDRTVTPPDQSSRQTMLLDSWKKGRAVLSEFWNCWQKEYLPHLRDRKVRSLNSKGCSQIKPTVGVIVIIREPRPRVHWRTGRVSTLIEGSDGKVRTAVVTLASGKQLTRPLKLLYPVEDATDQVEGCVDQSTPQQEAVEQEAREQSAPTFRRSKRAAATTARHKIGDIIRQEAGSDDE